MSSAYNFFAKKVGSSHTYIGYKIVQVTLLEVCDMNFLRLKTSKKDKYSAIVAACGSDRKVKNIAKPQQGEFAKNGTDVRDFTFEIQVENENLALQPNASLITLDDQLNGVIVDVRGTSKGRGFAGTIKRWNYRTQDASHGNSRSHRVPGSTGNRQDPGRTFPGKKMCGHYGDEFITVKGLTVVYINAEKRLIAVTGSVPGANGGLVQVKSSLTSFNTQTKGITVLNGINLVA